MTFQLHVVGDPSAGIQQVWVTYTGVPTRATWESLFLTQDADRLDALDGQLSSGLTAAQIAALQFMVQAVNGVGLVTLDDNQGSYYQAEPDPAGAADGGSSLTPTTLALDSPARRAAPTARRSR